MKYYIHKEGRATIFWVGLVVFLSVASAFLFIPCLWVAVVVSVLLLGLWVVVVSFFRMPRRKYPEHTDHLVFAPADGTIVAIEKMYEKEFFKDERLKISVFMSPRNVHVNRFPIHGTVEYVKYHPGKYLVAWHPKSSELNERNTVVVKHEQYGSVLTRQIAGMVARRIVSYPKEGQEVKTSEEIGFIKFGSRVDVFLPLNVNVITEIGEKVKSGISILAEFQ